MSDQDERPPVFKKWKYWYAIVLTVLVVEVIIFSLITSWFS